jgi:dihydroorotate dehydrogenase (fumarate)
MDLQTKYLGMNLKSPLVVSASPLSKSLDNIKKCEDAGAGAIVLYSLFEEQIIHEQHELHHHTTFGTESFAEALSYFPEAEEYNLEPDEYVEHIAKAKESIDIPVIASLNGTTTGGWTNYAKKMEDAGADAVELNIYSVQTDTDLTSAEIESNYLDILKEVKKHITIPVALKVSPFFTNFASAAKRFDYAGADAIVMFNRFYQPDIDLDKLEVNPNVDLSTPAAKRLPMRWIAILKGKLSCDMAATGGIHTGLDAIKMMMVGANVAMMASSLLMNGIDHLKTMEAEMLKWMEANEYNSIKQMQGSMSQQNMPDPGLFERAQYMKALNNYVLNF